MKKLNLLLLGMLLMPFLVNAQKSGIKSPVEIPSSRHLKRTDTVRSLTFNEFRNSINISEEKISDAFLDSAWNLWGKKNWKQLEALFTKNHLNKGNPPNFGADSVETNYTLESGMIVDRFGGYIDTLTKQFTDRGHFFGTKDVPFEQRSMADAQYYYTVYRVLIKIPNLKKGKSIPWSGQVGMGTQIRLPNDSLTVDKLKKGFFLEEIKKK